MSTRLWLIAVPSTVAATPAFVLSAVLHALSVITATALTNRMRDWNNFMI
jgi:hypothetical protein